jgi:cytochrome c-type biogenesis protein CcmE
MRGRIALGVLVLAVVAAVALVATAGAKGTLTYYRTPSEVLSAAHPDQSVRLGGVVVRGSVHRDGATVRFALTDGTKTVHVVTDAAPPSTFRVGQAAVVQGHLDSRGVFEASSVVVRHDNEYRAR